jgi:hypothetical protein
VYSYVALYQYCSTTTKYSVELLSDTKTTNRQPALLPVQVLLVPIVPVLVPNGSKVRAPSSKYLYSPYELWLVLVTYEYSRSLVITPGTTYSTATVFVLPVLQVRVLVPDAGTGTCVSKWYQVLVLVSRTVPPWKYGMSFEIRNMNEECEELSMVNRDTYMYRTVYSAFLMLIFSRFQTLTSRKLRGCTYIYCTVLRTQLSTCTQNQYE